MKKLLAHKKLHFYSGSSDKIYIINIFEENSKIILQTEYGRRTRVFTVNPSIEFPSYTKAYVKFSSIAKAKMKKGYNDITNDQFRTKFTIGYIRDLSKTLGGLKTKKILTVDKVKTILNMLNSGDEPSQVLAEEIILAQSQKVAA